MGHVQNTLDYWKANSVRCLPGNSDDNLDSFAERLGVVLPAEFREFYRRTDGTRVPGTSGADHLMLEFWPLDEVVATYVPRIPWAFVFSDYFQCAGYFAIDFTGEGGAGRGAVFFLQDGANFVATSFDQFLQLYIKNDHERLFPSGDA